MLNGVLVQKGLSGTKMEIGPSGTKIVEQKLSGYKSGCLGDFCSFDVWTLKAGADPELLLGGGANP